MNQVAISKILDAMVTNGHNLEGCSGIETHALRSISTLYSKGNVFVHKIIENQRYRWPS